MKLGTNKVSIIFVLAVAFIITMSILYGYFIFIYQKAISIVEEMEVDSMMSQTSFIMNDLNNEIMDLHKRQFEAMQTRSFNILAVPEVRSYTTYDVSNAMNEVVNTERILASNKAIVDDISVYFTDRNIKISAKNLVDSITEDDRLFISKLLQKNLYELIYQNGRIFVFSSLHESLSQLYDKTTFPYVFMISEISAGKILSKISSSFETRGTHRVALVRNDTGEILTSSLSKEEASLFTGILKDWNLEKEQDHRIISIGKTKYVVSYSCSKELGWTLYKFVSEQDVFSEFYSLRILILISIFIFLTTFLLFTSSIYVLIYRPVHSLIKGLSHVSKGELTYSLAPTVSKEFDSLFFSFNSMTDKLNDHIENEYKQKILLRESELKQLQLQINPHFLFNTFFILNSMLKNGNYEEAEDMSNLLGTYFEYIFHGKGDIVLLKQEVDFAGVYCNIQHVRYPRISVWGLNNLPAEAEGIAVPKLIMQPVLENAYKYAFGSDTENNMIIVTYDISGDVVQINIDDNGKKMNEEKLKAIIECLEQNDNEKENALANINNRLKLFYGREYGLTASRAEIGGLRISIMIQRRIDYV